MDYNVNVKAKEISDRWECRPENIIEMMHDIQNEFQKELMCL
jgi:hypothetical protein